LILTNRKPPERRGKVQLIDARELGSKMRKSLGEKRKEIADAQIGDITRLYGEFAEGEKVKIFPNEAFGFLRITVERPLRLRWEVTDETLLAVETQKAVAKLHEDVRNALHDVLHGHTGQSWATEAEAARSLSGKLASLGVAGPALKAVLAGLAVRDEEAPVITDRRGNPEPDPDLRDNENVPLPAIQVEWEEDPADRLAGDEYRAAVDEYLTAEVLPYVPGAWVDYERTKIGYEIPLTRHFYKYVPPRPLAEIDAEIKALEDHIQQLLAAVTR
jgi:type I restriction enzyme M protein